MLYLNPPYFVIDGVSIFPDDGDPLQFYYLPMMPHLTTVTQPGATSPAPQLQLIEYVGAAGTGGFLNFDCNLGLDDGVLSEVANQVQRQLKLTSVPRLSPVLFTDGTVKLIMLGAQSGDVPTSNSTNSPSPTAVTSAVAAAGSGPQFVVKVQNAAKPALYGDNQATFSVQLDQAGATVLHDALQGQMAPVAVIYSLQFLGLRPAFKVHMTADWNRVQTYLDQHYSGGFLFFSSEIEKTVDKLIEQKIINISIDTDVLESDLGSGGTTDRDQATAECYELIKTNFFESSLPPPSPGKPDSFASDFRNVSDMALIGGVAGVASFSYKKIDLTRTDKKSLDFNVSERTAVLRTIYPQGHLSGLLTEIATKGFKLSDYILRVDLDDPFFTRRSVTVLSNANFDVDSIGSIDVTLTYNGETHTAHLTGGATQTTLSWNSLLVGNAMQRPVSYIYTVNFKNVDTTQQPGRLSSGQLTTDSDYLDIEPRVDLYAITTVPVQAFDFPWDRYTTVEVDCRYVDATNGINQHQVLTLTSQAPASTWNLFVRDQTQRHFTYQITYAPVNGGAITGAWISTDAAKVDVTDPYPSKINLSVSAALDWSTCMQALVFVAYPDKASATTQQTYTLNESSPSAPLFVAERRDATDSVVYFEGHIIHKNGTVWNIPGSVTSDAFLIITDNMPGQQVLTVTPEQVDFASLGIASVSVSLRYVDASSNINSTESLEVTSVADVRTFAYTFVKPQISPEYSTQVVLQNNETRSQDWTPVNGTHLVVPLSQML